MNKSIIFFCLFLTGILFAQTNTNLIMSSNTMTLSSNLNFRLKNTALLKFPFILKFKSYKSDPVQLNILEHKKTNQIIKKIKIKKSLPPIKSTRKKKKETNPDFDIAVSLFNAKQFNKAKDKFETVATTSPGSKLADKSYFYISHIYATNNEIEKAIDSLKKVTIMKARATFEKILFYLKLNKNANAIEDFIFLSQTYPTSLFFFKASYTIHSLYIKNNVGKEFITLTEKKINPPKPGKDYLLFSVAQVYESDNSIRNIRLAYQYYKMLTTTYPKSIFYIPAKKKLQYLQDNFLNIK